MLIVVPRGEIKEMTRQAQSSKYRPQKAGGVVRGLENAPGVVSASDVVAKKRRVLAEHCRSMIRQMTGAPDAVPPPPARAPKPDVRLDHLAPRLRQTLDRMLAGDSEKEVARNLGISRHTVHIYIKSLYRHFDVNSRGELLAKFVDGAYRQPQTLPAAIQPKQPTPTHADS